MLMLTGVFDGIIFSPDACRDGYVGMVGIAALTPPYSLVICVCGRMSEWIDERYR
jgi:hypothetical protein